MPLDFFVPTKEKRYNVIAMKLSLRILFILAFATVVYSQSTKELVDPADAKSGQLEVEKQQGIISASLKYSYISSSKEDSRLNEFISVWFYGAEGHPPLLVSVNLYSKTKDCRFPNSAKFDLKFLLDDETLPISTELETDKGHFENALSWSEIEGDICNESIFMWMPWGKFEKIAAANTVSIGVEKVKIDLRKENIVALKKFVSVIKK